MRRVYILERDDRKALKVGCSFLPEVRAYGESRKRGPVRLLVSAPAPNGIKDERAVQRRLADYRIGRTEWFESGDADALLSRALDALTAVCGTSGLEVDGRRFPLFRMHNGHRAAA